MQQTANKHGAFIDRNYSHCMGYLDESLCFYNANFVFNCNQLILKHALIPAYLFPFVSTSLSTIFLSPRYKHHLFIPEKRVSDVSIRKLFHPPTNDLASYSRDFGNRESPLSYTNEHDVNINNILYNKAKSYIDRRDVSSIWII